MKKINPVPKKKKTKKKSFGLSDGTLLNLYRKAVKKNCGNKCIICGNKENLQCHHPIHRKVKVLRWDWRNGVTVCNPLDNKCHAYCDTIEGREKVRETIGEENWKYIKDNERVIFKDYIRNRGISETDWRIELKKLLLSIIND